MNTRISRTESPATVPGLSLSERTWLALIAASSIAVVAISGYCLAHGITIIFMHLFYFPIILLAYHYRYRGFLFSLILALAYVWLVYFFQGGESEVLIGAWLRFLVFAGVAAVVAYLSEHLSEDRLALQESERKYRSLFENMLDGLAYCRMIYDEHGEPADWEYLEVNTAFGRITGLENVRGKRVLEAIPGIRTLNPELFTIYGRVASTGKPETFDINFLPLGMWLKVSVFSPEKGYFVAVFDDITARKMADDALRESEKRYRDMFEINNAVMLIVDPASGMIADANAAACRYYGYSREELTGMAITQINIADPAETKNNLSRANGSQGAEFLFRHRKKSGEIRDVQVFSGPVVLGGRRLLHSIVQDVTDRQRAEEALRESEEKYRILVENAQEGIAVVQDGRLVFFNNWIAAVSGYSRDELVSLPLFSFVHEDDREMVRANHRLQSGGTKLSEPYVIRIRTKAGEIRWIDIKSAPLLWKGAAATINFYADISPLKKTVGDLQAAEERYRNLVENSHEIIYTILPDGTLTFVSPSWERLLGHTPAEVVGHNFREFVYRDDIPAYAEILIKTVGTRAKQPGAEYRVLHRDGSVRRIRSNLVPVFGDNNAIVSIVGSAADMTDYHRASDALALANRKLTLLSGITRHDIRNQLMALNAYIELSRETSGSCGELQEYVAREQRIADTIARQIGFTKDYEELGVKSAVWKEVAGLAAAAAAALPMRDIALDIRCPGIEIYADPLIEKVFYNLIDNSLRYGGDTLRSIRISAGQQDRGLRIIFEDDGSGVSREDKVHLFTKGFGHNTGLGLFLSREILSITGITIAETGEPGKGARFEITVPEGSWRRAGTP